MPYKWIFLSSLTALAFTPSLDAQWVPLTAEIRQQEFRVNTDGSETRIHDRHGRFYRSSDGSQLQTIESSLDGKTATASLRDGVAGAMYELDYGAKRAVMTGRLQGPIPHHSGWTPLAGAETAEVSGLNCVRVPDTSPNVLSSNVWFSPEHEMIVRYEVVRRGANGVVYRNIREIFNISLGREPDTALLHVPAGFTIQEGQP
jgi:hypothetical protein